MASNNNVHALFYDFFAGYFEIFWIIFSMTD